MTITHGVPVLSDETDEEGALQVVFEMETVIGNTYCVLVLGVDVKLILESALGVETGAGKIN